MAETKTVKVGVVGVGRGTSMMRYCECSGNAEIVAICDNWEQGLKDKLAELNDKNITGYTSYDEFLKHDMDVVVLAVPDAKGSGGTDRNRRTHRQGVYVSRKLLLHAGPV